MRTSILAAVLMLAAALSTLPAAAEKVATPPDAMRKAATNVIVGKVNKIYARTAVEGKWRVTRYVAEVTVDKSEKGDLAPKTLAYVRYWKRRWAATSPQPPSTNGHRGIPNEGDTLRIYAVGKGYNGFGDTTDGGMDVYGANGFEKLTPKPAK